MYRIISIAAAAMIMNTGLVTQAAAQTTTDGRHFDARTTFATGPRIGASALSPAMRRILRDSLGAGPQVMSQFGWQFELGYSRRDSRAQALIEVVPLIGGIEQGFALPTFTILTGLRTAGGIEVAAGPQLLVRPVKGEATQWRGSAFVLTAGYSIRNGGLTVPMNVALATGRMGSRIAVMTGFNVYE